MSQMSDFNPAGRRLPHAQSHVRSRRARNHCRSLTPVRLDQGRAGEAWLGFTLD
jgi:hypothetical protein